MSSKLRYVAAALVIGLACPIPLHIGVSITCAQQERTAECAQTALLFSPIVLGLTGVVCAFLVRGLPGFLTGAVGIVIGMAAIWLDMALRGTPVPIDIFQAVIATFWFGLPSVVGYSIARAGLWTVDRVVGTNL